MSNPTAKRQPRRTTRATDPAPARASARNGKKSKSPDVTTINVGIPKALHRKLRVKALENGMDLTAAITAAVQVWVK